jgi:hypothetical protein
MVMMIRESRCRWQRNKYKIHSKKYKFSAQEIGKNKYIKIADAEYKTA